MIKMLISSLMMTFSIMMYFFNHPLSMGLMILTQTLLLCLLSGMMIETYWFSYILFLTFLGGLLVMFIYVCSVASNEMFNFNLKMKLMFMITFLLLMLLMMNMNKLNWLNLNFNNIEMNKFFNIMFLNNENKINLNKLYNNQNYLMMMMIIIYLFIALIAIIKITNIFYGPLRSNN